MGPLTVLSTTLSYGLVGTDGRCVTRVSYDHRVMDGGTVARALVELETIMNNTLVAELAGCAPDTGGWVSPAFEGASI
jgi:hypothetical protein